MLRHVAETLAKVGKFERALQVAEQIGYPNEKTIALTKISFVPT